MHNRSLNSKISKTLQTKNRINKCNKHKKSPNFPNVIKKAQAQTKVCVYVCIVDYLVMKGKINI